MTFEEALEQKGNITYTNVGVSMMPLLRQNRDIMIIKKRDQNRLHKYDAVLFVRPHISGRGHYVMHRILKLTDKGYWIVGDNCTSGEMVPEENVIGVLTGVIRNGRHLQFDRSLSYKLYVYLWCAPYKFRFLALRGLHFARRCGSYVKRHIFGRK